MTTWLLVEDDRDIYDVLLAMFDIWDVTCLGFEDGQEALSWIDAVDENPRLVEELPELAVLDIRLPGVYGPEIGARLRRSPVLGNIAIALVTAYRLSPSKEEEIIAQSGADIFLMKPFPVLHELRRELQQVIDSRRASSQTAAR